MKCSVCNVVACGCVFDIKVPQPICRKCAGSADKEVLAEINYLQKEQMDAFQKANKYSLLGKHKMQRLRELAQSVAHIGGAFAELGVYKGGSAFLLANDHKGRALHLFDTFEGIPFQGGNDKHKQGDFNDTSLEAVKTLVPDAQYHVGLFPYTTKTLQFEKYAFVHIDADQEKSTFDACEYFWPRMSNGGIMLFDDYEWRDCPGVKKR